MTKKTSDFEKDYYPEISETAWITNPDFAKALLEEVADFILDNNIKKFNSERFEQLGNYLAEHLGSMDAIKKYCGEKKFRFPSDAEMRDLKKSAYNKITSNPDSPSLKNIN